MLGVSKFKFWQSIALVLYWATICRKQIIFRKKIKNTLKRNLIRGNEEGVKGSSGIKADC